MFKEDILNITANYESSMSKNEKTVSDSDGESPFSKKIMMISTHGYVAAEPPLGAPDTGGQVVFVLELSKVLAKIGYKVDIYTRQFEDQAEREDVAEGVEIIRVPCGGKEFIPKEYMCDVIDDWSAAAAEKIEADGSEYIFINSHYWDAGIAGMKLAEQLNIPHIHTPHSLGRWKKKNLEQDYPESDNNFEIKYNFRVRIKTEQEIFNKSQKVIATTPIQTGILETEYGVSEKKIEMIPPGYDDDKFYPMGEASKAMLKEKFNFKNNCVLALSRLAHNKGLDLLVEAFNILVHRYCDAQLVLAVGHDERDAVEESIYSSLTDLIDKYGLKSKVVFLGYVPDEDLADIYRAADLFILSSRYEPFGMTAIEAMACGTPTIVTSQGGLCRVLDDGTHALVADPFKIEIVASDMASIINHQGFYQNLSNKGSINARENFSWTEIAGKLMQSVGSEVK